MKFIEYRIESENQKGYLVQSELFPLLITGPTGSCQHRERGSDCMSLPRKRAKFKIQSTVSTEFHMDNGKLHVLRTITIKCRLDY